MVEISFLSLFFKTSKFSLKKKIFPRDKNSIIIRLKFYSDEKEKLSGVKNCIITITLKLFNTNNNYMATGL